MTNNRTKPEYIDELPKDVFEISYYGNWLNSKFNRYWWDSMNNRLIMKPKRIKKYKIVHPMYDKFHDSSFVHMFDINDNQIFANYEALILTHSIGYFLSIENYDSIINESKEL